MGRASLEGRPENTGWFLRKIQEKEVGTACNTLEAQGVAGIEKTMKWKLFFFIGWPENSLADVKALVSQVHGCRISDCPGDWSVLHLVLDCGATPMSITVLPSHSQPVSFQLTGLGCRILHLQWVARLAIQPVHCCSLVPAVSHQDSIRGSCSVYDHVVPFALRGFDGGACAQMRRCDSNCA